MNKKGQAAVISILAVILVVLLVLIAILLIRPAWLDLDNYDSDDYRGTGLTVTTTSNTPMMGPYYGQRNCQTIQVPYTEVVRDDRGGRYSSWSDYDRDEDDGDIYEVYVRNEESYSQEFTVRFYLYDDGDRDREITRRGTVGAYDERRFVYEDDDERYDDWDYRVTVENGGYREVTRYRSEIRCY